MSRTERVVSEVVEVVSAIREGEGRGGRGSEYEWDYLSVSLSQLPLPRAVRAPRPNPNRPPSPGIPPTSQPLVRIHFCSSRTTFSTALHATLACCWSSLKRLGMLRR